MGGLDRPEEVARIEPVPRGAVERLDQARRRLAGPGRLPVASLIELAHPPVGDGRLQLRGAHFVGVDQLHRTLGRLAPWRVVAAAGGQQQGGGGGQQPMTFHEISGGNFKHFNASTSRDPLRSKG